MTMCARWQLLPVLDGSQKDKEYWGQIKDLEKIAARAKAPPTLPPCASPTQPVYSSILTPRGGETPTPFPEIVLDSPTVETAPAAVAMSPMLPRNIDSNEGLSKDDASTVHATAPAGSTDTSLEVEKEEEKCETNVPKDLQQLSLQLREKIVNRLKDHLGVARGMRIT